jgi:hypothetical protein
VVIGPVVVSSYISGFSRSIRTSCPASPAPHGISSAGFLNFQLAESASLNGVKGSSGFPRLRFGAGLGALFAPCPGDKC